MKGLKVMELTGFSRLKLPAAKAHPAFPRQNQQGEQAGDANRCRFGWGID
ncbi:MAG: hypothetical protein WD251_05285 [Saccharospirillum sp.]